MKFIVIDTETAANDRAEAYFKTKHIKAPSTWKDAEKIKAREDEKRIELRDKAGLYPWTARVTVVCAFDGSMSTFYGNDERKILKDFGTYLVNQESQHGSVRLVGKSSKTFDFPMLVGRYIAHDLGVPNPLKPTHQPTDIDECFGYSSQSIRGTLSDYAFLMDIKGKTSNGSNAQAMFDFTALDDSKWDELTEYCAQDVIITNEFLIRYMKQFSPDVCDRLTPFTEEPSMTEIPF